MMLSLLLFVGAASVPAGFQPVDDALMLYADGAIYCDSPDHENRTCAATSTLIANVDGAVTIESLVPINNDPPVAIRSTNHLRIEGNGLCAVITESEINGMRITVDGEVRDDKEFADLLQLFRSEMGQIVLNKKSCSFAFRKGNSFYETITFDGVEMPEMAGEFAMLDADSGYRLHTEDALLEE